MVVSLQMQSVGTVNQPVFAPLLAIRCAAFFLLYKFILNIDLSGSIWLFLCECKSVDGTTSLNTAKLPTTATELPKVIVSSCLSTFIWLFMCGSMCVRTVNLVMQHCLLGCLLLLPTCPIL